ncbi:hypothetical protein [Streptomyces sp. NPDC047014]|uniref:hypothetical protein n=1 Tax=Streptomyces sp. NPDC047014 TaxID=3155736 RepID=UPI0034028C98
MEPTQTAAETDPGQGAEERCARVRQVLDRAGYETSARQEDGLRVWASGEEVLVGWVAQEVLRATVQVHGHERDLDRFTSLPGLHRALQTALGVVLHEAGFDTAAHGEHAVLVRARAVPEGGGAARIPG